VRKEEEGNHWSWGFAILVDDGRRSLGEKKKQPCFRGKAFRMLKNEGGLKGAKRRSVYLGGRHALRTFKINHVEPGLIGEGLG